MRISCHSSQRPQQSGYGLLIVMALMVVLLIVFASLMRLSTSNAVITQRNNLFNQSENAAEATTENIVAYMMRDFTYGTLGSASSYNTNFPYTNGWPIRFLFSATNGDSTAATNVAASVYIGQQSTSATNLGSQFSGLYGFEMPCTIACTATPLGQGENLSATIVQNIQFTLIPLFQFAIFYNMDLECNPGSGMKINGHVHSNGAIWTTGDGSGSSELVYSNYVEAAAGVMLTHSTNEPGYTTPGSPSPYVDFVITNNNPLNNANILSLPIGASTGNNNPTNVLAILNPPPAAYALPNYDAAYEGAGTNYLENEADLIISNTSSSTSGIAIVTTNGNSVTNIFVYYQNQKNGPNYWLFVQPDLMQTNSYTTNSGVKMTNTYAYYSFVTNASFYDYREVATAKAIQINVTNLDLWIANTNYYTNAMGVFSYGNSYNLLKTTGSTELTQQGINSIYAISSVPLTSSQLPAVRVVQAQRLPPSGLTVATPDPIYVMGNYNTTTNGSSFSTAMGNTIYTAPAALMGDAVTILSSSWNDTTYISSTAVGSRVPVNTTINAATLEGIVPSTNPGAYSGGVENFLRLLENWSSSTTLTYNGSIVVMFPSQYATNTWNENYYGVPTRAWAFDTNFNNANLMPPLTPQIKTAIRGSWSAY